LVFNMSFIYNNAIKYSDSPNLDAFGRLRTAAVTNLLDIKHVYDKNPLQVNEVTAGTATSVFNQEYARVRMSTSSNNDLVIRQTKTHPIYQPGKSQLFEGSFSNFQLETNVIKRVGCFTSTTASTYNSVFDGFFLESNGLSNTISFQIWRSGTTIFSSSTTTWETNEFNPINLNWSNTQLMTVDYQWLGVGRLRFGLALSGQTFYFTEHNCSNNESLVYMSSPNQPIRYEIRQVGLGSGSFDMICSQVSTEGALNGLYSTVGVIHSSTATLSTSGTKYPYIGYRLKQLYKAVTSQYSSLSILNTSNDNYLMTIEYNPTLSVTPTWTDIPNSPFQYSLGTGATTITSSGHIMSSLIGEAGTSALTTIKVDDNQIRVGSNVNGTLDEMWVCITPLGANATFLGTAEILYYL
jgi:hypothetical protein